MADRAPLSNEYRSLLGPPNRPNATEQERMLTYVSNAAGGACVEIRALFQFRFGGVDQGELIVNLLSFLAMVKVYTNCVPEERRARVAWVDDIYELACLRLDDGLLPLPSVDFFLEDVKQGMDVVSLSALRGNRNTLKPGIICHPLRQDDAYNFEVIQHSIQLGYGASGAGLLTDEGSLCGLHYGHDHNQIMLAIPVPQLMKFFIDAAYEDKIAIAALKDKDGSSLEAIAEYTKNHFPNLPPSHLACSNLFINQLKDEGVLLTAGNNYMISPDSSHLIPTSFPKRNPPPKPRPNPVHRPPRPKRRPFLECYKVTPVHKGPGPAPKHQIFYREWSDKPGLLEDGPWRYCDGPSITFFLPVSSEAIERVLKETESIEPVSKETEPVLGRRQRSSDSSPERRNTRPRGSQSRIIFVFNNSAEGRLQNQLMHASCMEA
ncbi:hypothetical protein RJ640_000597 [Escallonia rubra]|uniref:Uncharacterized protein n=1 Tax=Escallonia rubra TaxID=112253 RepID=A0AA88RN11_9ASTE|nr:hypothetical protein RJ640_000597 [Escallonia rubra]